MVNPEERAICSKRGHSHRGGKGWAPCTWCGTWVREVRTIEEREDEPPQAEQDPLIALKRLNKQTDEPPEN